MNTEPGVIKKIIDEGRSAKSIRAKLRYGIRLYKHGFPASKVAQLIDMDLKRLVTEINVMTTRCGAINRLK